MFPSSLCTFISSDHLEELLWLPPVHHCADADLALDAYG
jgi:hypothetical protein